MAQNEIPIAFLRIHRYGVSRNDYCLCVIRVFIVRIARLTAKLGIVLFHITSCFAPQNAHFVGDCLSCNRMVTSYHNHFDSRSLALFYSPQNSRTRRVDESHNAKKNETITRDYILLAAIVVSRIVLLISNRKVGTVRVIVISNVFVIIVVHVWIEFELGKSKTSQTIRRQRLLLPDYIHSLLLCKLNNFSVNHGVRAAI
mmetsp:Transcript_32734/g.59091  ORF Transcript_32734/g.59091 Transcript_32734/m.59091 type:complete len:200 (-) Transcript_32734:329-928(-)